MLFNIFNLIEDQFKSNYECPLLFIQISSLPKAQLKPAVSNIHEEYDIAHNSIQNCAQQYSECDESIWDSGFLFEIIK